MDHRSTMQHLMMKHCCWGLLLTIFSFTIIKEAQGSCSQNWLNFGTTCIRISQVINDSEISKQSYPRNEDSSLSCTMSGGELISISSLELLEFLTMHFNSYQGRKFWVGASTSGSNDTEANNQPPWVVFPQGFNTSGSRTCYTFDGVVVTARDCSDDNMVQGHICSKNKPMFNPTENCLVGLTEHSFVGEVSGNCVYRSPDATSLDKVNAKCAETGGRFMDLDEIAKEGLTAFREHNVMTNDGFKYWTAMTCNNSQVYWASGLPFLSSLPLQRGSGNCVTVSFNFSTSLKAQLYQTECADQAHVICAAPRQIMITTRAPMLRAMAAITLCPQGHNWKTFRVTGDCYWETSFETRRLSWDDARAYCKGFGGDLASFHSIDEEKIGLSFQYGTLAHPYWIGLKLDPVTETYKWSDGTLLDYQNWAPNHPDHKDKRMRCVAMDAASKHWISSICGMLSWFVCKAPKRVNPPPPRIPPRNPLPTCSSFPTNFYYEGYCYEVVNMQTGWHRAKEYCQNKDSSLVSIHTDEEIGFLLRLLYDDQNTRGNRVWIGLNSLSGTFKWTDFSPVDLTYWNTDEPNNHLNQEKCVNMYMGNGLWNDENCNFEMGFICKRIDNATFVPEIQTTIDPLIGNCKKGWYPHHDSCYLPVGIAEKDRVNWTTANSNCQNLGGYLVAIRDAKDQAFLSYLMQGLKEDTWIGLHDTIQSGRYFWVDSSDMRYTNWAIGEPSFFGIQEDCVKMVYDEIDSGVWKDDVCENKLPYICRAAKDPNLPKPTYNRGTSCIYPEGWLKLDDMCFKMYAGNHLTWSEAEEACQRDGAHLISVSGSSIQAVATYLRTEVNKTFWIGLQYKSSKQEFEWLNGWIMTFSKWGKGAPAITNEDSCIASTYDGYWKDFPCNTEMPYICQITTGKGPYLTRYGGECPKSSNDWIPTDGSYCHLYGKRKADFFSASLMCFRQGSFLISLHSLKDIEMVKKTLEKSNLKVESVYIGLTTNLKDGFSWSDHTAVDFVNWDQDQPENDGCVEMLTRNFKWRVVPCSATKNYICSHPKDQEVEDIPENAKLGDGASGLSVGSLVAIIVCLTLAVIVIIVGVLFFRPSLGKTRFRVPFKQHSMSFENALYNVDSSSMEFQDDRKDSCDST